MNYHGTRHYPSLIPREQDLMSLSGTFSMKLCRWCLLSPPTRRKDATGLQTATEEVPCGPWGPVALPHRHRATPAPGQQTRPWLERVGKEVERKETVKDSLVLNPARGSSFFYLNFLMALCPLYLLSLPPGKPLLLLPMWQVPVQPYHWASSLMCSRREGLAQSGCLVVQIFVECICQGEEM